MIMEAKRTLTYHKDDNHGWVAVPKVIYNSLPYRASRYSYQSEETVFLEQDYDFPMFEQLAKEQGHDFELYEKHHPEECFVRYLERLGH